MMVRATGDSHLLLRSNDAQRPLFVFVHLSCLPSLYKVCGYALLARKIRVRVENCKMNE